MKFRIRYLKGTRTLLTQAYPREAAILLCRAARNNGVPCWLVPA